MLLQNNWQSDRKNDCAAVACFTIAVSCGEGERSGVPVLCTRLSGATGIGISGCRSYISAVGIEGHPGVPVCSLLWLSR